MAKTVAALFENRAEATSAVQDLVAHDVARDDISLITHEGTSRDVDAATDTDEASGAAVGAGIGAALGGVGGLLVGLSALAVPGIGPVIAAGPLATALLGAGVGAAAGGLIGAMTDIGISEEHAQYYGEGLRRGGVLVTVACSDARAEHVASMLARHHPIDLGKRVEEWRAEGWTRFDPQQESWQPRTTTPLAETRHTAERGYGTETSTRPSTGTSASSAPLTEARRATEMGRTAETSPSRRAGTTAASSARTTPARTEQEAHTTIPLVEETLEVEKQARERDVRVHTTVTETPVEEQVRLREEHIAVERRPVDRPATSADQQAFQEGVRTFTETVEEPVVTKQARVVEEVVIHKEVQDHVQTVHGTVRHTDVDVEHEQPSQRGSHRGFETYETDFRQHFRTAFGQQPEGTYEGYMPAYRFGYTLATEPRYSRRDWNALEAEARRDWEQERPGTWERFKAAIQHAWQEVRGPQHMAEGQRRTSTPTTGMRDFDAYRSDFRQHYNTTFSGNNTPYDDYEPAYRFGYDLGSHERYHGRDWETLEADARRDWETRQPGTWERFKQAIRHGWEQVRAHT
ncbi:MAG: DUF2382 domain-containing protein [Candidatus Tectimicrobiota bacterium]